MASNVNSWTVVGLLIGALVLIPSIMGLFSKNKFDVNGKTVLVTGASDGMGKSVAKQLASKGGNVIILARNIANMELALGEIKASAANPATQRFHYISADVSQQGEAARAIEEAITWNDGRTPDIVWCVAGTSHPSLFIETPLAKMRQQMDMNFWSCSEMAHAILSKWLAPSTDSRGGDRHLIFTSSVVAFYSITGYAPYSPPKAAIKSLSDTLAQEVLLYGDDVKIHTVFPGTISSPGLENENKTKPDITFLLEDSDPVQTPDEVAAAAIAGLEKGEYLVTVGWLGAAMRACAWGGAARNNYVLDTAMTWITSLVWGLIRRDLDGKVRTYGKKNGHPSTYVKRK